MDYLSNICPCNVVQPKIGITERVAIAISVMSLIVSARVAYKEGVNQEKNEAYLRYSYWLNMNWDIINKKYTTNLPWRESDEKAKQDIIKILDMFEKEFPDPTK